MYMSVLVLVNCDSYHLLNIHQIIQMSQRTHEHLQKYPMFFIVLN